MDPLAILPVELQKLLPHLAKNDPERVSARLSAIADHEVMFPLFKRWLEQETQAAVKWGSHPPKQLLLHCKFLAEMMGGHMLRGCFVVQAISFNMLYESELNMCQVTWI